MIKTRNHRKGYLILKMTAALSSAAVLASVTGLSACAADPWLFYDNTEIEEQALAEAITLYKGQEGKYLTLKGAEDNISFQMSKQGIIDIAEDGEVIPLKPGNVVVSASAPAIQAEITKQQEDENIESEQEEGYVSCEYYISVCKKKAYKALNKAKNAIGSNYSQSKRMKKGYYDCSSLVWRSYSPYGIDFGDETWAPTAADQGKWCDEYAKLLSLKKLDVSDYALLPGDVLYYAKQSNNGRYKKIYHTAIFEGYQVTTDNSTGETTLEASIIEADGTRVVRNTYHSAFSSAGKKIVVAARPVTNHAES